MGKKMKNYARFFSYNISDDISVTKMYNWLVARGAITFVDKVGHKRFMVICRDIKTAKRIVQMKTLGKNAIQATCKYQVPFALV